MLEPCRRRRRRRTRNKDGMTPHRYQERPRRPPSSTCSTPCLSQKITTVMMSMTFIYFHESTTCPALL